MYLMTNRDIQYKTKIVDVMNTEHYTKQTPYELLNQMLLILGTNIDCRKNQLKTYHDIHKFHPIVIDGMSREAYFPVKYYSRRHYDYINAKYFFGAKPYKDGTIITFNNDASLIVDAPYRFVLKQYEQTLRLIEYEYKVFEHRAIYQVNLNDPMKL